MKKSLPAWAVLTAICVVAAVLLALTNMGTKDIIAENANREAQATMRALLPDADSFEALDGGLSVGKDAGGNPVGYVMAAPTQGFGGEVEPTVAARPDGTIAGIRVGGANFAETAGLGARAKEPEFQAQFAGKKAPVSLTKDGGEIEALSGATVTSRAVVKGTNEAMSAMAETAGFTVESTSTAEDLGGGRYTAVAYGYAGPVRVTVTIDENRSIASMEIGDADFAETEGMGKKALTKEFRQQFIGKTLPLAAGDVDAISGATFTTNAVLDALGQIDGFLTPESTLAPVGSVSEADAVPEANLPAKTDAASSATGNADGASGATAAAASSPTPAAEGPKEKGAYYSASAQGYAGSVRVFVTLDEKNTIKEMKVGDSQFAETEGLGKKAQDEAFTSQFIGKTLPLKAGDVDGISGATFTTTAVLKALDQIAGLAAR